MTVNLKALAAELKLSQTTVSRALNGYPEVSEATRRRVLEAAERTGYRPSPVARRLATGRAHAFGIVFPVEHNVLQDPHFAEFLGGVAETAARHGFDIVVSPTRGEEEIAAYERLARDGTVDAVILTGPMVDDPRIERIAALGFPVVVHGSPTGEGAVAHLDIANEEAFRHAAAFLVQLGHRRIALLNGEERFVFARDRHAGFLTALGAAGIPAEDGPSFSGAMTVDNGYRFARAALARTERPTALVCSSVLMALGALRAAAEAGLSVPEDLSIIAHDDEIPAFRTDYMHPPMTTTRSPIRSHGARIAEMAIALIGGEPAEKLSEVWPVDLVVRRSTAPPPG